jgi:hypothetical protein
MDKGMKHQNAKVGKSVKVRLIEAENLEDALQQVAKHMKSHNGIEQEVETKAEPIVETKSEPKSEQEKTIQESKELFKKLMLDLTRSVARDIAKDIVENHAPQSKRWTKKEMEEVKRRASQPKLLTSEIGGMLDSIIGSTITKKQLSTYLTKEFGAETISYHEQNENCDCPFFHLVAECHLSNGKTLAVKFNYLKLRKPAQNGDTKYCTDIEWNID